MLSIFLTLASALSQGSAAGVNAPPTPSNHIGAANAERPRNERGDTKECRNIIQYGADPTGNVDVRSAFEAATEDATSGLCLYFPAGTYKFGSTPIIALPSDKPYATVTIKGDGAENSRLVYGAPDIDGLDIELRGAHQSFHVRDLSLLAPNDARRNVGISIVQVAAGSSAMQSDISNVTIRGADGYNQNDRFGTGIAIEQSSNILLLNDAIFGAADKKPYGGIGVGLKLVSGTSSHIPIQFNIAGCQINFYGTGIDYGSFVQGVQIVSSNFTGNGFGIAQAASSVGNDELSVVGSQFNSGAENIVLASAIDGVTIAANDFYLGGSGSASIDIPGVQFSITGNTFIQLPGKTQASAIEIGTYRLDAGIISANSFSGGALAIHLKKGSSLVNVQANAYSNSVGKHVADDGSGNRIGGGSD